MAMKFSFKTLLKILGYGALAIVLLLIGVVAFIFIRYPKAEAPADITIERTPARLERGQYLVNQVLFCMNCHGERGCQLYSAPVKPGTEGKGVFVDDPVRPAWSANITPFGIGEWSDGEVVRAITAGIKNDGTALHPLMPFDSYAHFSLDDVYAVVAYLRTLQAIEHIVPETKPRSVLEFLLLKVVARTLPEPYTPPPHPDESDGVAYGKYLATIAECAVCHKSDFSGGASFQNPPGQSIRAKNITPATTGIGIWSRENFISVFKSFDNPESRQLPVPESEENTGMPWVQYAGMSERDLGALYDYLRTVEPVETVADSAFVRE